MYLVVFAKNSITLLKNDFRNQVHYSPQSTQSHRPYDICALHLQQSTACPAECSPCPGEGDVSVKTKNGEKWK